MVAQLFAGRQSRAERAHQRRQIDLEEAALSDQTRARYYLALRKLLPTVERCASFDRLDDDVCNWIHTMWKQGEPLLTIGDAMCALHFFQPVTKRILPHSWKLFKVWRKVELPSRAPPLTWTLLASMAAFELEKGHLEMSCVLLLAFHCLLRTGEALALTADDILLGQRSGILRLRNTKSGRRNAANEVISVTSPLVLEVVRALYEVRAHQRTTASPLWTGSPASFRQRFQKILAKFHLQAHAFRPYSLRRGGATDLFQRTGSMEAALLRGRWESSRVARVYIADGLSYLPSIKLSSYTAQMLARYHF